ncbi:MAG: enoyl-CoA hydratase/isomerase family protein [Saprospiraceae bacterium]|nr:enoyl-CoA hydratase/isomerase family protein [Saprospiraceae bacterium]MBP7679431.1 enoyl-CoA hydratase/isomerase family protein [Saprospiraceae bacterium]
MTYETLLVENRNGVVILTINRPDALNALNKFVFNDLRSFFATGAATIPNLAGVVITGAGDKAFAAGADIKEFAGLDANAGAMLSQRGQDIFRLIETFHKPVIAAIQGFALGGGCELAMACHLRIAGEKARFGQPEVNLGLIPGYGATQRLPQLIGKAKALELLLTGDMINAEEALRLGLVNKVVAVGEEVAAAIDMLERIATKAPFAISKVMECVQAYFDRDKDGYAYEIIGFGKCCNTQDFKEGAAAFVEKRRPNFTGK